MLAQNQHTILINYVLQICWGVFLWKVTTIFRHYYRRKIYKVLTMNWRIFAILSIVKIFSLSNTERTEL